MAENIEQNLELEKILATLASLPKSEATSYPDQQYGYQQTLNNGTNTEVQQTYPPPQQQQQQQHLPIHHQPADPRLSSRPTPDPRPQTLPRPPQDRSSTPFIDPSTITEWKQGLRCVSKIAAQKHDFATSIRKLIKDQEQNFKVWEAGRTRLIEDQKVKRENEKTHRAALSLPGLLEGTAMLRTPEREQQELTQYDAKVYRACKAMTESQSSALKVLGVPFFGTKPYLIVNSVPEGSGKVVGGGAEASSGSGGKVTKEQLLELQRKMLNHLMELYGD